MIMNYKIKLDTFDKVKKFVNAVQTFESDIDLTSDRYIINAKSIMGIFSLDLSKPLNVVVHEEDGVNEANKIFAVLVAVCSFLWFKNLDIPYSWLINTIGASTFGILLIHANSDAMRTWLWRDTVDCVGHYALPLGQLMLYAVGVILIVFSVCALIDYLRIQIIEKPFFKWFDKMISNR